MNTTAANIICLIVGLGSAYRLMLDTEGAFAIQKADVPRIVLAFFLCLTGGWFTQAKPWSPLYPFDWAVIVILAILAAIAYFRRPIPK